jgi:hypothetical protein
MNTLLEFFLCPVHGLFSPRNWNAIMPALIQLRDFPIYAFWYIRDKWL